MSLLIQGLLIGVLTVRLNSEKRGTLHEFLLELLVDQHNQRVISWTSNDGEFRLHKPEEVACLWGLRKNRNNMNYDKMSRSMRYLYDRV